jgi:Fe-Mn family superoxide dismutase
MFELKKLPYSFDALEPVMSAELLELHYSKHHQTYTNNFNIAITDNTLEGKTIEEIFANISQYSKAVENHGGGYFNHEFF